TILQNNDSTIEELKKIITQESVDGLVVGKSVQIDGTENSLMREIRHFLEKIDMPKGFPIELEDERFSSIAAQAHLYSKGNIANPKWSGKENTKKREHNDAHAAVIILQRFLDKYRTK